MQAGHSENLVSAFLGSCDILAHVFRIEMMNEYNLGKASARIPSLRRGKERQSAAAFEFVKGGRVFWSMPFPPSGVADLEAEGEPERRELGQQWRVARKESRVEKQQSNRKRTAIGDQ
jgi:hypothetical protein